MKAIRVPASRAHHLHRSLLTLTLIILPLVFAVSGCLALRLLDSVREICEHGIEVRSGRSIQLALSRAILFERDVTCLLDAEPSIIEANGDRRVLTYLVAKDGDSRSEHAIPIRLTFDKINGDYRLRASEISKNLSELLPVPLFLQIVKAGCGAQKDLMSVVRQRFLVDISAIDRDLLPSRARIVALFGQPNGALRPPSSALSYSYSLQKDAGPLKTARFTAFFEEQDGRILKLAFTYLRYNLEADFTRGQAVLTGAGAHCALNN